MLKSFLCFCALLGSLIINAQVFIKSIDKPFEWLNKPSQFIEQEDSTIIIDCKKGETLFTSPFSGAKNAKCPVLLFEPSKEFTLNAKLTTPMEKKWDAAQIVVWRDSSNWAKVYLEKTHYNKPVVGSIVNKGMSDDCNSIVLDKPEVYLQVAKIGRCCFFYYSTDGKKWVFIRGFNFDGENTLKVGFSCESTFNEHGTTATFSKIVYKESKPSDMFNGI